MQDKIGQFTDHVEIGADVSGGGRVRMSAGADIRARSVHRALDRTLLKHDTQSDRTVVAGYGMFPLTASVGTLYCTDDYGNLAWTDDPVFTTVGATTASFGTAHVEKIDNVDWISFEEVDTATVPATSGTLYWDRDDGALSYRTDVQGTSIQIGQEVVIKVVNKTAGTLLNGQCVYINGAQGNRATCALAISSREDIGNEVIGVLTNDIPVNEEGYATIVGMVRDIDTSAFPVGSQLWLSPTVAGGLTDIRPDREDRQILVGTVTVSHSQQGTVLVRIREPVQNISWTRLQGNGTCFFEPSGFSEVAKLATSLSFSAALKKVYLSFNTGYTSARVFSGGQQCLLTANTQYSWDVPDVSGKQYYWISASHGSVSLHQSNDVADWIRVIHGDGCPVAATNWDSTTGYFNITADERHGCIMDGATHSYLHKNFGAIWQSGGALGGFKFTTPWTTDNAKFSMTSAVTIADEDIEHSWDAQTPLTCDVHYLLDAGVLKTKYRDQYPFVQSGAVLWGGTSAWTDPNGYPAYNKNTAGVWTLEPVTAGNYWLVHIFATNNSQSGVCAVLGQNVYSTLSSARDAAEYELNTIVTGGLFEEEMTALGTVVYQSMAAPTAPRAQVVQYDPGVSDYYDWRTRLGGGAAGGGAVYTIVNESVNGLAPQLTKNHAVLATTTGTGNPAWQQTPTINGLTLNVLGTDATNTLTSGGVYTETASDAAAVWRQTSNIGCQLTQSTAGNAGILQSCSSVASLTQSAGGQAGIYQSSQVCDITSNGSAAQWTQNAATSVFTQRSSNAQIIQSSSLHYIQQGSVAATTGTIRGSEAWQVYAHGTSNGANTNVIRYDGYYDGNEGGVIIGQEDANCQVVNILAGTEVQAKAGDSYMGINAGAAWLIGDEYAFIKSSGNYNFIVQGNQAMFSDAGTGGVTLLKSAIAISGSSGISGTEQCATAGQIRTAYGHDWYTQDYEETANLTVVGFTNTTGQLQFGSGDWYRTKANGGNGAVYLRAPDTIGLTIGASTVMTLTSSAATFNFGSSDVVIGNGYVSIPVTTSEATTGQLRLGYGFDSYVRNYENNANLLVFGIADTTGQLNIGPGSTPYRTAANGGNGVVAIQAPTIANINVEGYTRYQAGIDYSGFAVGASSLVLWDGETVFDHGAAAPITIGDGYIGRDSSTAQTTTLYVSNTANVWSWDGSSCGTTYSMPIRLYSGYMNINLNTHVGGNISCATSGHIRTGYGLDVTMRNYENDDNIPVISVPDSNGNMYFGPDDWGRTKANGGEGITVLRGIDNTRIRVGSTDRLFVTSSMTYFDYGSNDIQISNGNINGQSAWTLSAGGTNSLSVGGTSLGFFTSAGTTKPTVTGSRAGNAALASLLTALANLGLITNSTGA